MKSKHLKRKPARTPVKPQGNFSDLLRTARRTSAYAFVAGLGVWLPKADAATLVSLDATALPLGETNSWANSGALVGDFVTGSGATTNPTVVLVDGVKGMSFLADGGVAGAGSHFAGPNTPASLAGASPRTVEAWIFNDSPQDAETVFSWGRRGADGLNNAFGHGGNTAWGAVGMWGAPDIGWGNTAAQVAANRVINRWTYIVQSFDGTNNSLYVDGRLANTEGPPATALVNTADVDASAQPIPLRVARETEAVGGVSAASVGNFVAGRIRVHDAALSSTTISNQFFIERGDFNLNDTDGDGMPDWWEARYGLDKNSNADATDDLDSDNLNNLAEYNAGAIPTDSDSDDDGISDGAEVGRIDPQTLQPAPTSPIDADTDDDSLLDGVETDTGTFVSASNTGTDPLKGDTDGDVASDGTEIGCGSNPTNPASTCGLSPLVSLDATALPEGLLTNWINTGSVVGNFVSTNANTPAVVTTEGVKGIAFLAIGNGDTGTHYVGPAAPNEITGAGTRTIEAWVLNRTPQGEETVFGWGRRGGPDGSNVSFGHGTDATFGAVGHWGAGPDIGWAGSTNLSFARWNHIAYTYDGTTQRVYADGVLANSENTALNTHATDSNGNPLVLRVARQNDADGGPSDTGVGQITIGKIRVYSTALDGATIKARFESEKGSFNLNDTDGDGLPDWYEIRWGLDKNDGTGNNGATGNPDNDGLNNAQEFAAGTGATVADTDDDGANDGAEVNRVDPQTTLAAPTNPINPDTDGDGLRDGVESDTGTYVNANNTGTDPLDSDTDNDNFSDGLEVSQGSNPVNPISIPTGDPVIHLIATNLPAGPLTNWANSGTFSNGFAFTAQLGFGNVQTVQGVTALRFPGAGGTAPYYQGPTNPAAANVTGNSTYSIEAWVHSESPSVGEEVVFAWGRRGADNINSSFNYGTDQAFGAMGHWGGADLGWNNPTNPAAVIMDRWTHIVYTYNANTFQQVAYINGVQVNSEVLGTALNIAAAGSGGEAAPFRVGAQNNANGSVSGTGRANGLSIGELRLYTLNLSASQVLTKFNVGANLYGINDTDGDGMPSWFERTYPGCLNENLQADGAADCDGDGLSNTDEFNNRTNPTNPDTDGDGLSDGAELNLHATNPNNPDTDVDGLLDSREIALTTLPSGFNSADTDGDGFTDSHEVVYGSNPADIASTPNTNTPRPFVTLDATTLPLGPLPVWTNNNALGWRFTAPTNAVANVAAVEGTKGVQFFTTNHYIGPTIPSFFGGGAVRTVEAWIYNPTRAGEETLFSWGRRGGPDGTLSAFIHGSDPNFGALGFWGGPDVPWGTNAAQIASNVVTSRWTHVAYTYGIENATNGVRACYVDGVFAHSEVSTNLALINTHTYDPLDPLNVPPNNFGKTLPFRVGAQSAADGSFDAGASRPTMTIAKVRAYDVALSAAQIAANYNAERVQFPGQPRITNVRVQPNGFVSFDWVPTPGRTYEVQRNDSLDNPNGWSVIGSGLNSGSFTNDPGTSPKYYRMRVEPLP